MPPAAKPRFFRSPEAFGRWLEAYHGKRDELVVGYWKVATGKPSMAWEQSVEGALRFGWIDGVRHSLGSESFTVRFTPRRPTSLWSLRNLAIAERLIAEGRMAPAGLAAFRKRRADRTGVYIAEQAKLAKLSPAERKQLATDAKAEAWFKASRPSYQKSALWWVVSAKKPETRARRLQQLIDCSREGRTVPPLTSPGKK